MAKRTQRFGGPWSILKLETVERYLASFTKALKHANLNKVYIDAFAGSGTFSFGDDTQTEMFDEYAAREHAGSATRALKIDPPFERLFFLESKKRNIEALKQLVDSTPGVKHRVEVLKGDANKNVVNICTTVNWRTTRGVVFLDPFGNAVEWDTLKAIARTEALDVWYLFPLQGVVRNTPLQISALSEDKRKAVTHVLGTHEWESHFYEEDHAEDQLFPAPTGRERKRSINVAGIESFVHSRLKSVFPHVEPPVTLLGTHNAPIFSLFFAVSNPNPRAQKVAIPIARHLLKQLSRGTRPKSAR